MTSSRWAMPSMGFMAVCLVYGLLGLFFIWGFSTPNLDRVWTLQQELELGQMKKISRADRRVLTRSLAQYPGLAHTLLASANIGIMSGHQDGWLTSSGVTIIRTPKGASYTILELDVQVKQTALPLSIEIVGQDWQKHVVVERQGAISIRVPAARDTPEVITMAITSQGQQKKKLYDEGGIKLTFPLLARTETIL